MDKLAPRANARTTLLAVLPALVLIVSGCAAPQRGAVGTESEFTPLTVVVAPVLNLSGVPEVDTVKLTDFVAGELQSFRRVAVVPVNLTLAALARRGQNCVETPADATALAHEFGADATVVTALTEYDPYDPPRVGLVMQWYAVDRQVLPAIAIGGAPDVAPARPEAELSADAPVGPSLQVQRVFDAASQEVLREVRQYADARSGHPSPHGWHRYTKSQELYLRYCCWAVIRTMLRQQEPEFSAAAPHEVKP